MTLLRAESLLRYAPMQTLSIVSVALKLSMELHVNFGDRGEHCRLTSLVIVVRQISIIQHLFRKR